MCGDTSLLLLDSIVFPRILLKGGKYLWRCWFLPPPPPCKWNQSVATYIPTRRSFLSWEGAEEKKISLSSPPLFPFPLFLFPDGRHSHSLFLSFSSYHFPRWLSVINNWPQAKASRTPSISFAYFYSKTTFLFLCVGNSVIQMTALSFYFLASGKWSPCNNSVLVFDTNFSHCYV